MDNQEDIYIYNAIDKDVHAVAFGNHFNLKPGQIKRFRYEVGHFLDSTKGYLGLVSLSNRFDDPAYKETEEGKAELAERREVGVKRYCDWLRQRVNNLQVSLRQDLEIANIKASIETQATDGDIEAMDELLHYQRKQEDQAKAKSEHARVALQRLKSAQNAMVNKEEK